MSIKQVGNRIGDEGMRVLLFARLPELGGLYVGNLVFSVRGEWDQCCGDGCDGGVQDVEPNQGSQFKYILQDLALNKIGSIGVKLLTKADLPLLHKLWLSTN